MKHELNDIQKKWIKENSFDFSHINALFLNCTLKRSPQKSHTEELMHLSQQIMDAVGVKTELLRPVDYDIAPGTQPDMTEHGWEKDDWPQIQKKVLDTDILVFGAPIWLGEISSIAKKVIERLDSFSENTNEKGQTVYYGRTAGCVITGNEDGVKHCSMGILYSLQHLGFMIPPQSDTGWIGDIGPGKSYADEGSGGPDSDYTNRTSTFLAWNLLHTAKMLADNDGMPAHGNQQAKWE